MPDFESHQRQVLMQACLPDLIGHVVKAHDLQWYRRHNVPVVGDPHGHLQGMDPAQADMCLRPSQRCWSTPS